MAEYRLTVSEKETIVTRKDTQDRSTTLRTAQDEDVWHVFSEIPKDVRRLTKLFGEGKPVGSFGGREWEVPTKTLRINKKRSVHLTESQRRAMAERLRSSQDAGE